MHIKQVNIRGFKTYKEQVSLSEDFHPGVNVVVGFNGSGKSNFFNAILFVISDYFGTLRAETRKALLHEGAGPAVLTAFVELVFDNKDRRMPIDKDEVRIRRTIAAKKDDYMLDGKHATKAEVFNLLESCGFTKSNPYYIVQQGKIAELTLMNDARRLELIKEISGASVYDDRRAESQKILEEIRDRRLKTDEVIQVISQRIRNLEDEQRELVEFQQLGRQRRCIEFELTDRDWRTTQNRVDQIELERKDVSERLNAAQREVTQLRAQLGASDGDLQQEAAKKQRFTAERDEAERARAARWKELLQAKLELEDESKLVENAEKGHKEVRLELQQVVRKINEDQLELERAQPDLESEQAKKSKLIQRKQICEIQRDQLLAKQGRRSQYSSIDQRNAALGEEISRRQTRIEKCGRERQKCEDHVQSEEEKRDGAREAAAQLREKVKVLERELNGEVAPELNRLTAELERHAEERRLLMQRRDKFTRERAEAERQVAQSQMRIEGTMPRAQRNALSEVKRWVVQQGLQNDVYGTLLDNIRVTQDYAIAAEGTAGNSLFNLLVKDDVVAGNIISLVRKGSLGSIVCTPMSRLAARPRTYPQMHGVKPLVDVMESEEWVRPAVHQVFGKFVVCSTLELCDEVSRKYGLDTITLDGDKVSSRGTLTGGYQDPARFIRFSLAAKVRQAQDQLKSIVPEAEKVERQARDAAGKLEELHEERRNFQEDRGQKRSKLTKAAEDAQEAEGQVSRHEAAARRFRERRDEIQNYITECETAIVAMQAEMKTKVLGDLTADEQAKMQELANELRSLEGQLEEAESRCHKVERAYKAREQHLQDFLRKRLHELESELMRASQADHKEHVHERGKTVERLEREHGDLARELDFCEKSLVASDKLLAEGKEKRDKLRAEEQTLQDTITEESIQLDDLVMKANMLTKKKHEADEKLRGLTIVSSEMSKYKDMSPTDLMKDLGATNKKLGKFEHVNKKAIDQFATFKAQLVQLEEDRQKIDESMEAIGNFMKLMDEEKDETLLQTLKQVDVHFQAIFSDLVRNGIGRLQMLQLGDQPDDDAEHDGQAKGVGIEVSFSGQNTSFLTMAQLSGGQKTVVAIALIFAIQRLEPAPFYLFDEIDAALDTQYRTAVARLIEREAANAQMVITTFRPEIIEKANQLYRVYLKNRVSCIDCVSRQAAQQVIEEQTRLERPDG